MNKAEFEDLISNLGSASARKGEHEQMDAFEPHYTVQQIAEKWHLSEKTVRGLFRHEPGVIIIERAEQRFKRGYCTIRVPDSVMRRVHAALGKRIRKL